MTSLRTPKAILLIGFMGAGKSSVGRALADVLGWKFEDLDECIERREGRRVAEIFRVSGEDEFRRAEYAALMDLLGEPQSAPNRVIALGGGAFVRKAVADLIESAKAHTIFLDAGVEELRERCQRQATEHGVERPLLGTPEAFSMLYQQRRPHYLRAAMRQQTDGRSVAAVVAELVEALQRNQAGAKREME